MRTVSIPRAVSSASSAEIASFAPETTHSLGALTAAMDRRDRARSAASTARTSASAIDTLNMPPGARVSNRRPRTLTSDKAASYDSTPARHAATYSPMLWPIIASGVMPHDISRLASAYSVANSVGNASDGASRRLLAAAWSAPVPVPVPVEDGYISASRSIPAVRFMCAAP